MKTVTRLLTVVLSLQILTLAGQWLGGPRISPASAQIANPGADRQLMIDEMKVTNSKLDKLISILEGGKLQVVVQHSDDPDEAGKSR